MTTEDASMQATPNLGSPPTRQVFLNFDILAAMIPYIENRRDLLSFMSTCSGLYNAGIPALLGFHFTISVTNISQFYYFLVTKSPIGFSALRGLYLAFASWMDEGMPGAQEVGWLTEILSQAKNLQYLEIYGDLLHQNPSLYKVLVQLPCLQTLDLSNTHGEDHEQSIFVSQLQSPLSTLRFAGVGENFDMVNALKNFHNTLRELVISEFILYHLPPGPIYSNVVDLSLTGIINSQLSILIPAFPNLKFLEAKLLLLPEGDPATRDNNVQFQVDYPRRRWQLSRLLADASSLFTLAICTGVPEVEICDFSPDFELEDLKPSLDFLRPLVLTFENAQGPFVEIDWLSKAITDSWNELARLEFTYAFPPVLDQCNEHLVKLYNELELVAASKPNFVVLGISLYPDYSDVQSKNMTHSFLVALDMHAVASRIAQAIPTLILLRLRNPVRQTYWVRQEEGFVPFPLAPSTPFERLSKELLAPLRKKYCSNPTTTDNNTQTQ